MKCKRKPHTASIMGIERLRDNTDGPGIRTLVLFDSCPLHCDYCINRMLMNSGIKKDMTPDELYDLLVQDGTYFELSEGGVTFGGGEPALQPRFLKEFSELIDGEWNIMLETSLNVPLENVMQLVTFVDRFYVDVKEMNRQIYQDYTRSDPSFVYTALDWLAKNGYASKVVVRVPLIPDYNTEVDQAASIKALQEMGFETEAFTYYKTHDPYKHTVLMGVPAPPEGFEDLMGDPRPEAMEDFYRSLGDEREEEM